jgi:adenylate cyclase
MAMDKELGKLREENEQLKRELEDLRLLNETNIDHSTRLENELVDQNMKLDVLQNKMRKYLSPQLFESLVGGTTDAVLAHTRKKLTIFFSDIVNFSEITDSVESELLSEVLNEYLNRMAEIAMKCGGTIDKFIGDAIMVFFGDPEYIDDVTHARQCAKMGLEMLQVLQELRAHWRELGMFQKLRVRMGINTGYCTVGNFGSANRMEYTIVGGQVNIASRLETIAEPDSIYISNSTFALIQDIAECRFVDDITVKGVHYPIEVYKLIKLKGTRPTASLLTQTEKHSFELKQVTYDHITTGAEEKGEIKTALNMALGIIERAEAEEPASPEAESSGGAGRHAKKNRVGKEGER